MPEAHPTIGHAATVGHDGKCGICAFDIHVSVTHVWPPQKSKTLYELRDENETFRRILRGLRENLTELGMRRQVRIITNVLGDDAGQPPRT